MCQIIIFALLVLFRFKLHCLVSGEAHTVPPAVVMRRRQTVVKCFAEYLGEGRLCSKGFPLICFSTLKRTINEHVNLLLIKSDPSSLWSCHCWSECGGGLTVTGTGVFLCGLVITWVVSESDNTDTIRKLSCHVSYILVSCLGLQSVARQWNAS